MTDRAFSHHRQAAMALFNSNMKLSRKEGGFLGNVAVEPSPLTDKQASWLAKLLERAGLPPLSDEVAP